MFFALEGLDGSGKSTLSKMFFETLVQHGRNVVLTCEPGATLVGTGIRELLLSGIPMNPVTEYLLFAADRAEHLTDISFHLKSGRDVVTDRFFGSSLIYQGAKGVDHDFMRDVFFHSGGFFPDITFWLDVSPEVAAKRIRNRKKDHFESSAPTEFRRRQDKCEELAEMYNWIRIDTDQAPEDCLAEMIRAVMESSYISYAQEVFGG